MKDRGIEGAFLDEVLVDVILKVTGRQRFRAQCSTEVYQTYCEVLSMQTRIWYLILVFKSVAIPTVYEFQS